jgi:hypothetical protein
MIFLRVRTFRHKESPAVAPTTYLSCAKRGKNSPTVTMSQNVAYPITPGTTSRNSSTPDELDLESDPRRGSCRCICAQNFFRTQAETWPFTTALYCAALLSCSLNSLSFFCAPATARSFSRSPWPLSHCLLFSLARSLTPSLPRSPFLVSP